MELSDSRWKRAHDVSEDVHKSDRVKTETSAAVRLQRLDDGNLKSMITPIELPRQLTRRDASQLQRSRNRKPRTKSARRHRLTDNESRRKCHEHPHESPVRIEFSSAWSEPERRTRKREMLLSLAAAMKNTAESALSRGYCPNS